MVDESGYELKDYKVFAFDGEAKAMFIASDRTNPNEETKFDFFDMDFNHLPFTNGHPNSKEWDRFFSGIRRRENNAANYGKVSSRFRPTILFRFP